MGAIQGKAGNLFSLGADLITGGILEGDDAMVIGIVQVIELVCRMIDKRVMLLKRERRNLEGLLGTFTIHQLTAEAVAHDLQIFCPEGEMSGPLKFCRRTT